MNYKNILTIKRVKSGHWVGDGFPVVSMLSYYSDGMDISPFLLLDYAGPMVFKASDQQRGVETHPHRGFETVTIVYQGEVEHRDNVGNHGKIGPGDVQWMTAARGILHEEKHSREFTQSGGTLEMIQLWVNLPAKDKMSDPHYQEISNKNIPLVNLENDAGTLRIIAGSYKGTTGPAKTFTPVNLWDMHLKGEKSFIIPVPEGHNGILLVLKGQVTANTEDIKEKELIIFDRTGDMIEIHSKEDSTLLFMSGEAINEPIAGRGPFVMNTEDEIKMTMADYAAGKFGPHF